jgi:class 3 adenylate cyclase
VREVAPLFGVRVDKWLGDGVMLVGVEAEPVVTATIAIGARFTADGRLSMRAGIATGDVILVEGDEYVGRTVNVAARLCDQADAGEVIAATPDVDSTELPAAETRSVTVRGVAEVVPVSVFDIGTASTDARALGAEAILAIVDGLTRPARALRHPRLRG